MIPRLGVDRWADADDEAGRPWRGARLGLVTNDVALTGDLRPARLALLAAGYRVVRLFSPEHGLSAQGRDGEGHPDAADPATGLPVVSLYGERFAPGAADLAGLDAVVVDLPDVGCRFYTYLWTMTHVMEACAEHGVPLVVLDRPNPLGGRLEDAEGPLLEPACASFVGRWPIPVRHSLTLGELAAHWAVERLPALDLTVVPMLGWRRDHLAAGSGDPWVPPSPAMASAGTALLYPGTGLLEGVAVSEGRGTALPFRVVGAPWLDGGALADELAASRGVAAVPYAFTPLDGPLAGRLCRGVLLTVTHPPLVRPVALGLRLLRALAAQGPLPARSYPTAANPTGAGHLDRLLGVPGALGRVLRDEVSTAVPGWESQVADRLVY